MRTPKELPPPELWNSTPFLDYVTHLRENTRWYDALVKKFPMHPCVLQMLKYKPLDYVALAMEYPHTADLDPTRLAYTRNLLEGEKDRQLVTSIGKYLARHWPHINDHERRDIQALFTPDKMYFVRTTPEIITAVENGPRSCMASVAEYFSWQEDKNLLNQWLKDKNRTEPNWASHPYSAYAPEHGWYMAIRAGATGSIDGRALCMDFNKNKYFVRTYRRHPTQEDGWSETDFILHAWLLAQGFISNSSWPEGVCFTTPVVKDQSILLPYLDGNYRHVEFLGNSLSRLVYNWTPYKGESTSGIAHYQYHENERDDEDDDEDFFTCECCDERTLLDESHATGRNGNGITVCEQCANEEFVWINDDYLIHKDDATYVRYTESGDSYYIDDNRWPDDIVTTFDGDIAELSCCVQIDGEYHLYPNDDIAELEMVKGDEYYVFRSEGYFHEEDSTWWLNEEHYLEHNPGEETDDETDSNVTLLASASSS